MSLVFNAKAYPAGSSKAKILAEQWNQLSDFRAAGEAGLAQAMTNAGRTPADTYREFDSTTKIEVVAAGHLALLTRVLAVNKPVNIGKEVYEYRQASRSGTAVTSMSGQKTVTIDHTAYSYAGTIVPIHDEGFGRPWRQKAAMESEMFDALVDDAREAERTLMEHVEKYMFEGNSTVIKGAGWTGLRNDSSVIQATVAVDTTSTAVSGKVIRDEFKRLKDIIRITNKCTGNLVVGISNATAGRIELEFSEVNETGVTVQDMILKLSGISEVVEDASLADNEIVFLFIDEQGFHSVVGMPLSTYPEVRMSPRADFNFVKSTAVGFLAKQSKAGLKTALFAAAS